MLFPMFGKKSPEEDDLKSMNRSQKKEFLSNDLIARMIRLEQRVSASFGEIIPYNKTKYYQSLTFEEKKDFEKYLKTKVGSKFAFTALAGLFMAGSFFMRSSFTGNAVKETSSSFSGGSIIVAGLAVVGLIILLIYEIHKRRREKMFKSVLTLFGRSIKRKN